MFIPYLMEYCTDLVKPYAPGGGYPEERPAARAEVCVRTCCFTLRIHSSTNEIEHRTQEHWHWTVWQSLYSFLQSYFFDGTCRFTLRVHSSIQ